MSSANLIAILLGAVMVACTAVWGIILIRFVRALDRSGVGTSSRATSGEDVLPYVSIVVAARNEDKHIAGTIQKLLSQTYPAERYEVIIADDRSQDSTSQIVLWAQDSYPGRIKLINIESTPDGWTGKKWALQKGVERAGGEIILTTDADCVVGSDWVDRMVSVITSEGGYDLVGGPVDYLGADNWTWPARLLRTEFVSFSLAGASSIAAGMPLVISAQNMAYRKDLFEKTGGYAPNAQIPSGDDVFLLFAAVGRGARIGYLFEPEATVLTHPPESIGDFINQRLRWASKGIAYPPGPLLLSTLIWSVNTLFLAALIAAIVGGWSVLWPWLAVSFLLKATGEMALLIRGRYLGLRRILFDYITGIPAHMLYIVLLGLGGTMKLYRWK